MKMLSPHLSVAEFVATQHRDLLAEQERAWAVDPTLQMRAEAFAGNVFEPVRALVGPLHVSSGLRCPALNTAVGGQRASRHLLGLAVDVIPMKMSVPGAMAVIARAVEAGALPDLDEAILELGWLHLQGCLSAAQPRHRVLMTFDTVSYEPFDALDERVRRLA